VNGNLMFILSSYLYVKYENCFTLSGKLPVQTMACNSVLKRKLMFSRINSKYRGSFQLKL